MSAFDRRCFWLWSIVTLGAATALFLTPVLILLIFSIVGIPFAVLLGIMPGAWVYLTPTFAIYALLRRYLGSLYPALALSCAAILPLAIGFVLPTIANRETARRVDALLARDHGAPPQLPRGLSIVYAIDRGLGARGKCDDVCQRLLFSRTAASYAEVPLDRLPRIGDLPKAVHRFSLGPIGPACDNSRLSAAYASDEEVGAARPPPLLWDKLPQLAARGLCLHDDLVRDTRPDLLVVERWNFDPAFRGFRFDGGGWRLSLHPIAPFRRREVLRRTPQGWVSLMRRTQVERALLARPLWLESGFSFDTATPTHWAWQDRRTAGSPITRHHPTRWSGMIANDLAVEGLR